MSAAVMPKVRLHSGAGALDAAARSWFVVAVAGQLMFALYIGLLYGGALVRGDLEAWNKVLPHGYAAGHAMGNVVLGAHLLLAAVINVGGPLQLIPQVRGRFPALHRWNGRIYLPVAFVMGLSGLYLTWSGRRTVGDAAQHVGISINAVLILVFAALAWRTARARDFAAHRPWALRLFLAMSGVWFFRVGLMFWLVVNRGPAGFDPKSFTGPFLTFLAFAQYLLPLAVLELYLHARGRSGPTGRYATAAVLFVATAVTGIGVLAAAGLMWLPRV
jgi:hypothetical protein